MHLGNTQHQSLTLPRFIAANRSVAAVKVRRKEKGRGKGAGKCKVNGKSRRETKRLLTELQ